MKETIIPQIIIIFLMFAGFGYSWARHGEPKEGKYNLWTTFFAILVEGVILWWGGFFNPLFN